MAAMSISNLFKPWAPLSFKAFSVVICFPDKYLKSFSVAQVSQTIFNAVESLLHSPKNICIIKK